MTPLSRYSLRVPALASPQSTTPPAPPRFAAYRDDLIDAESLVSGCALAGMMCFTFVLFATACDVRVVA